MLEQTIDKQKFSRMMDLSERIYLKETTLGSVPPLSLSKNAKALIGISHVSIVAPTNVPPSHG